MNIVNNDNGVARLSDRNVSLLQTIHDYIGDRAEEDVILFESIHGFIAGIHFKKGMYTKGFGCNAKRMDKDELRFYADIAAQARWFEFACGRVAIGLARTLDDLKITIENY